MKFLKNKIYQFYGFLQRVWDEGYASNKKVEYFLWWVLHFFGVRAIASKNTFRLDKKIFT